MANIDNIVVEQTNFTAEGLKMYVGEVDGTPIDKWLDMASFAHHFKENTTFAAALSFDLNYTLGSSNAYDLSLGDLVLSLEGTHTPIVGKRNIFRVIGDGTHSISLGAGFDTSGVYPDQLDGAILSPGVFIIETWYDIDGVCIEAKKFLTASVQPPSILSTNIDINTFEWVFRFNEPVNTTGLGFTLLLNGVATEIDSLSGSGSLEVRFVSTDTPIATDACTFNYSQIIGDCLSVLTSAELQDIDNRRVENNLVSDDNIQLIGDLTMYFLASDLNGDNTNNSSYTDGQNVGAWNDKSGNGYNLAESNAFNRPVYREEFTTGESDPVVLFSSNDKQLDLASSFNLSGDWTLCIAAKSNPLIGNYIINIMFQFSASGINVLGSSTRALTSASVFDTIFFIDYDSTRDTLRLYLNDAATIVDESSTVDNLTGTINGFGYSDTPSAGYQGSISAMCLFSKVLSDAQRVTVYNTILSKTNFQ